MSVCETCVCVSVSKLCLGECMSVRYVSGKFVWDLCVSELCVSKLCISCV